MVGRKGCDNSQEHTLEEEEEAGRNLEGVHHILVEVVVVHKERKVGNNLVKKQQ